jgi:putative restriction endonuclease
MTVGEESVNNNLAYYRQRFEKLNVNTTRQRGKAKHQPILLLSIIDLIAQGVIRENRIYVSDDLVKTFDKYDELFNILQEPDYRAELIDTLVAAWFSLDSRAMEDILQVNQGLIELAEKEVEISADIPNFDTEPKFYLRKSPVRNAIFRKAVVEAYDYRCAFCRLKVMRTLTQNIVDGSHIKPFSQFYDNQVDNGISLCKNHHWAFDQGWFSIDDEYRIIVANDLEEESPNAKPMKDFHTKRILLPRYEKYLPKQESLQWHQQNVFKA